MPTPSLIVKFRQQRRNTRRRKPGGKLGLGVGVLSSLLIVLGIIAGLAAYADLTSDLPSLESIPARLEPPDGIWLQPTRLYDRSGEHELFTLQHPAAADGRYLNVSISTAGQDSFAQSLEQATVAALDPSYWQNPGYAWDGIRTGDRQTLAQRLVDDLLLSDEPASLRRNIRERILAGQLISRYGHAQVLEWYLNSTCYGPLVYGADAASQVYFGKSASELSVAQAAWLTAAAETPAINPLNTPQSVLERQQQIIAEMLIQELLTVAEAHQASGAELHFRPSIEQNGPFEVFTNLVLEQIATALPGIRFERGGLRIITTLDYDLQLQAACALETQVRWLQGDPAEVLTADGEPCDAARLLPTLSLDESAVYPEIAASLVGLDPDGSQVLVMVGADQPGQDPAHLPGQPAGTLLTPFIYLSAFVRGFSPATLIWEVPEINQQPANLGTSAADAQNGSQDWEYHGPVRLRTAFANDYLPAAAQLYQRVGAENAWQTAWQFGMNSLGEYPVGAGSLAEFLDQPVMLLESVHAFSVFTNLGTQTGQILSVGDQKDASDSLSPVAVIRIEDSAGDILLDWSHPQQRPIVSPQLAFLVTDVLSDEVARWTSLGHPNPLEIGRPAGARLGTSLDGSQAWTVGYIPQMVVGTWLGVPDQTAGEVPKLAAAALWNAVIKYASQDLLVEEWHLPTGMTALSVCDPSGLLPTHACPAVVDEVFIAGNEPTQMDNLYQVLRINRETGQRATVFTPSELVEEQVFLVVPGYVEPWTEQAGLPVPPKGYDSIYVTQQGSDDVQLTAPAMFEHVRGNVEIRGSAAGSDMEYYRIQVGQGLNPTEWLLVGEDEQQPVQDGRLGVWDTRGLEGLFVVQLSVVHTDQRVESVVLQVTVDNTPPVVTITDPTAEEQFQGDSVEAILLQAAASDNLVVERLEFYLDDELYLTLWQPPYAAMWPASSGEHFLRVRAYDLAGNSSEQTIRFEVQR